MQHINRIHLRYMLLSSVSAGKKQFFKAHLKNGIVRGTWISKGKWLQSASMMKKAKHGTKDGTWSNSVVSYWNNGRKVAVELHAMKML